MDYTTGKRLEEIESKLDYLIMLLTEDEEEEGEEEDGDRKTGKSREYEQ